MNVEIKDAVNSYTNKQIISNITALPIIGKYDLTVGSIGCWHSHRSLWSEILEKKIGKSLILEDDVDLVNGFKSKISSVMSQLETKNIYWDILYVGHCFQHSPKDPPIISYPVVVQTSTSPVCTHAYAVSLSGI
ncbi:putative inactive glycosyltransferase 25 family member 3 [Smittium culicis]|uniref:Putative inactive glycosyltransferase 25 family member 3 n=1 Tax=Smittium culicis TaxID=133412 RepID=A0A1R1XJD6_9FUNG|nr:putative inactive glycosyltransferase 25 family member 3 [Smittium culicis]